MTMSPSLYGEVEEDDHDVSIMIMIMMMSLSLEGEVESQRQQRLSDAKQVEAKAARIKVIMKFYMVSMW